MTCVLDLQVCLDNQRLIGGITTKRSSHAHGLRKLYFTNISMDIVTIPCSFNSGPTWSVLTQRFLGLFPLSSSLPFPLIMTCVLDLQVCLDNQRLIGGITTKRSSHAHGLCKLYFTNITFKHGYSYYSMLIQ